MQIITERSGEEASYGFGGQDASRPPSVDSCESVPRGEQAPIQGRARRPDPELPAVREGDLSDRLHQQDDRGAGVPSVQGSW